MPTDIRIIQAHDYLKVTPEGKLDLKASKELLMEIASSMGYLAEYEILVDTRKAQTEMSESDLSYLASDLINFDQTFHQKTALLCPAERINRAKFFALFAQNQGYRVEAFDSFEEAIGWLISNATGRSHLDP
jgi:uncharacterized protein YfeS